MSLWRWTGERFDRLGLSGPMRGLDAFLCCPGPSLRQVRPEELRGPGAVVIAVNTAYPHIRPDLWIGMDRPECYDRRLLAEGFWKVFGDRYRDDELLAGDGSARPLREFPNVSFLSGSPGRPHEIFDRLGPRAEFLWNGNTFQTALHLAAWLGCGRIYLLGCDFGSPAPEASAGLPAVGPGEAGLPAVALAKAGDYHDGRRLRPEHRRRNAELYAQLVDELPLVRLEAVKRGIEIVSCTPASPANRHLPYLPLEAALDRARREHIPAGPDGPVLDAADAERCRWGVCTAECPGVLTGADAAQEWLLPWWWGHYRRHNRYPVAFADFGLTAAARAWCAERGRVIRLAAPGGGAWFAKPLAILATPFRWTAWLDADCEVRGELAEVFAFADRGLAVTADPHYPLEFFKGPHEDRPQRVTGDSPARGEAILASPAGPAASGAVSTGLVGARHGEPAVCLWAAEVFRRLAGPAGTGPAGASPAGASLRDDQAALNLIRPHLQRRLVLMPRRFQRLRLDGQDAQRDGDGGGIRLTTRGAADGGPDGQALVMHWTGPAGKEHVRKMAGQAEGPRAER